MPTEELPDAELEVLACLWHLGPSTARTVREAMGQYRPMSHAAVFTLLGRLVEKELVTRRKGDVGKAFVYRARVRPGRTYREKARALVQRIFGGSSVALVSSLFETQPPSHEEIEQLQELLDELRSRRGKGRRS